jgi:Heme exporter protein D (CcmD)
MSDWNWRFVIAAYCLTWAVLAGYAFYLWRRERHALAALSRLPRSGEEDSTP